MPSHEETLQQLPDGGADSDDIQDGAEAQGQSPVLSVDSDRPQLLWAFPALLGVFVLVLNIFVLTSPFNASIKWIYRGTSWGGPAIWASVITSIFLGLFLIVYAFLLRHHEGNRSGSWYLRWVVVPILLALLAPLVTLWGINYNRELVTTPPLDKACVELYQAASSVLKDNPKFRMPPNDPDEQRCGINNAIAPQ